MPLPGEMKSDRDLRLLARHLCPACARPLVAGPRGGAAQNFYCSDRDLCRLGYNLTFYGGKLLFAQRLGEIEDERFALYAGDG